MLYISRLYESGSYVVHSVSILQIQASTNERWLPTTTINRLQKYSLKYLLCGRESKGFWWSKNIAIIDMLRDDREVLVITKNWHPRTTKQSIPVCYPPPARFTEKHVLAPGAGEGGGGEHTVGTWSYGSRSAPKFTNSWKKCRIWVKVLFRSLWEKKRIIKM